MTRSPCKGDRLQLLYCRARHDPSLSLSLDELLTTVLHRYTIPLSSSVLFSHHAPCTPHIPNSRLPTNSLGLLHNHPHPTQAQPRSRVTVTGTITTPRSRKPFKAMPYSCSKGLQLTSKGPIHTSHQMNHETHLTFALPTPCQRGRDHPVHTTKTEKASPKLEL